MKFYMIYISNSRGWCFSNPVAALKKEKKLIDLGYTVHVQIIV